MSHILRLGSLGCDSFLVSRHFVSHNALFLLNFNKRRVELRVGFRTLTCDKLSSLLLTICVRLLHFRIKITAFSSIRYQFSIIFYTNEPSYYKNYKKKIRKKLTMEIIIYANQLFKTCQMSISIIFHDQV